MPSVLSSRPPFLTLDPPASPFNPPFDLSPLSSLASPKSGYSHDQSGSVSPLTPEFGTRFPEQSDISRLSGFPQASGFDFNLQHNSVSPSSPSGEHDTHRVSAPNVVIPPGGVYRERNTEEVAAPPPYERYSRYAAPAVGYHATRSSIAAGQYPTGPAFPVPVYGRHHARYASTSGPPRRFSGQRHLRSLTLTDVRTIGYGYGQPQLPPPPKKQASWRIFGGTKGDEVEKQPLTNKGKWIIYIAAATTIITIAIVSALVATMRPRGTATTIKSSLSGFPVLPAGLAQILPQGVPESPSTACVLPKTLWSCDLPPDTLFPTLGGVKGLPNFTFTIRVRNTTTAPDSVAEWAPFPERIPDDSEYAKLADVDGIQSDNKSGEKTPFYISLQTDKKPIVARDIDSVGAESASQELESVETESAGHGLDTKRSRRSISRRQAAKIPSQMLPGTLLNQPLRLFDRGLESEHYGFFVYYKKTINVLAADPSSVSPFTEASDADGGVAAIVTGGQEVTWENTRFRVAIWTKKRTSGQMDVIGSEGQRLSSQIGAFDGSFPYPVSVIEDRNGDNGQIWYGKKNFQAATIVKEEAGKICSCEWRNWRSRVI